MIVWQVRVGDEWVRVDGYSSHVLTSESALEMRNESFYSTLWGHGRDNPTDPLALSYVQRHKSVSFFFENTYAVAHLSDLSSALP